MIAFCTTCKGRAQHIRTTLPRNLADNPTAKFILVDYNSPDDLQQYVYHNHFGDIERGQLVVYSYTQPGPFRMAHAKNMAHRLAMREGADVLVNLDADNFASSFGPQSFATYVEALFRMADYDRKAYSHPEIYLWARMMRGVMKRGISGRIAMTARAFLLTGGYDERYSDWGPDDKDMNQRLGRLGLTAVEIETQYLDAINHKDQMRFREYPHAAEPLESGKQWYQKHDRVIANFGHIGCGTVFRNFDFSTPIKLRSLPTRIFGIGMQKTATTSLDEALKILGFDSAHWIDGRWAMEILHQMRGEGRSATLEKHYALCDLPIPILFKELDRGYPGSKFILTVRDDQDWLQSARDHWSYEKNQFRSGWDKWPATHRIHCATYGQTQFDAEIFLARYRAHNAEVREYFRNRPDDLLTLDMSKGAGWNELCPFVERPIPDKPYPRAYAAY